MDSFKHEMELKRHRLRPHEEKVDLRVFSKVVIGLGRRRLHSLVGQKIYQITQHASKAQDISKLLIRCVLRVLDTCQHGVKRIFELDADVSPG